MIKKLILTLAAFLCYSFVSAQKILIGDMNGDDKITTSDVIELVDVLLGKKEKMYVNSVEKFINENALSGTFSIDGIKHVYVDGVYDPYSGCEYVDLGLSVKWATCNIGADAPEKSGCFFSWGEIKPKTNYVLGTYQYCDGTYFSMNKYCTDYYYGTEDFLEDLEPKDDAATMFWGGEWHVPTIEQQDELCNKCNWVWTDDYMDTKVAGYVVTSRVPGYTDRSIFFPAAGKMKGNKLVDANVKGCYWSKTLYGFTPYGAYSLVLNQYAVDWDLGFREQGYTVRAVCP